MAETVWHVGLQPDGWPTGISDEGKRELTATVLQELQQQPMTLHTLHYTVQPHRIRALEGVEDLEWIYCALDRAARAAGAEMVYRLRLRKAAT
jgi:hypothetical protein